MDDTTPTASGPHAEPSARYPRQDLHRVTWELELLLSGAVAFALLQVPEVVDRLHLRIEPHLGERLDVAAFFLYYYVKLILYTLITSFVVHLAARAYWVGLIGLDSVFPQGIRWERLNYGPLVKEELRRRLPSIERMIVLADRFSSSIFSFAFVMVAIFIFSLVLVMLLSIVGLGVSELLFDGEHLWAIVGVLAFVLLIPGVLVTGIDKAREKNPVDPEGGLGRALRRAYGFNYNLGATGLYAPITMTLFSNTPKKLMYPVSITIFTGMIALFMVKDLMVRRGRVELEAGLWIPTTAAAWEVQPRHYESLRDPDQIYARIPSIQADIVRDPYVRLFVPYAVSYDEEDVGRLCPDVAPPAQRSVRMLRSRAPAVEETEMRAALACVAGLWEITLDGQPVAEPDFRYYRHPVAGVRGIVAYLPTRELPRGQHLLVLERVEPPAQEGERSADEDDEEPRPPIRHHIPFWI